MQEIDRGRYNQQEVNPNLLNSSFTSNSLPIISDRQQYELNDDDEEVKIPTSNNNGGFKLNQFSFGWKDLMLRPELLRVIREIGFQFPSEVQKKGILQILKGRNLICQAKSGTGKTAVFVISMLQLIQPQQDDTYTPHQCLIIVPTRELAHQIFKEFLHFRKYIHPVIPVSAFFGGIPIQDNLNQLCKTSSSPAIIISTPGRLNDLQQRNYIIMSNCKYFILDECDKVLENPKMRADFWCLYQKTPRRKQTMMFSATISPDSLMGMRQMMDEQPSEVKIVEDTTLLDGLTQFFLLIPQIKKLDKLYLLLDNLAYNQCIIFVNRIQKARKVMDILKQKLYNPIPMHSNLRQDERIVNYDLFKENSSKILVATDLFGRGVDIEKVNLVINYDFPRDPETYLHRVGRAGRFGAKGIAINFVKMDDGDGVYNPVNDATLLTDVKQRFNIKLRQLPSRIDISEYL